MIKNSKEIRFMKILSQKLSNWIENKVISARAKGVVMGLSGGLDSAVVAVLCKNVFPSNTLTLIIPCHSLNQDLEDAKSVIRKFHLDYKIIDLSEIYNLFISTLNQESIKDEKKSSGLARANLIPRLRMIVLYYFANKLNYLVVGTGNKSELMAGYFTKYGDGGVDILPLGNLLKTQVRELAKYLDIPQRIIDKAPSAGLWKGQTDEGEMGITYQDLDEYLTTGTLNNSAILQKIQDRIFRNSHKRRRPEIPDF